MRIDFQGKQVFAATGGKPFDNRKSVVIFLHGSGLDHTFWGLHAKFFVSCNYAVLVPDLPGHTNSEGPALDSIEAIGDWLNDVVESLDAKDVSLVAHSQGCLVALEFASRYPDRIRSLSITASGLALPVNKVLLDAAKNDPEAAIAMVLDWGFGSAGDLRQGQSSDNSIVAVCREAMHNQAPGILATDLRACDSYNNGIAAAEKISVPAQVIVAGKDRMVPTKATAELIEHLGNPHVAVIPESGHMLPQEVPDQCRDLLRDFIFLNNSPQDPSFQ